MTTKKQTEPKTGTRACDVAEQLRTPEEMAAFRDAWLSREGLYRALSEDGNSSFAIVLKVARALGVRLHAEPT